MSRFVILCGLSLVVGCAKPESTQPKSTPSPTSNQPSSKGATTSTMASTTDAATFATAFLTAVNQGQAKPSQLTAAFKGIIAEPVFEADRAVGYSDSAAELWLKGYAGKVPTITLTSAGGSGEAAVFVSTQSVAVTLRLVKSGTDWQVDWFHATELVRATVTLPSGEAAYQAWAAAAFLESLLGRKDVLAMAMMHPQAKARLAPPFGSSKDGFNRGGLEAKLATYRGGFNGFSISKVDGTNVSGEVMKGDVKKPFTIKLVKGQRADEWLIDDVKID